jgi:hypothetical protein
VLHPAAAVDQHADLTARGRRGFDEGSRELWGEDAVAGDAAAGDALDGAEITGGEARGVSVDLDGTPPKASA